MCSQLMIENGRLFVCLLKGSYGIGELFSLLEFWQGMWCVENCFLKYFLVWIKWTLIGTYKKKGGGQ
jgi:hypothetical protein